MKSEFAMRVIDHGEDDFLTPTKTELDRAIHNACRISLGLGQKDDGSLTLELIANGIDPTDTDYGWLKK